MLNNEFKILKTTFSDIKTDFLQLLFPYFFLFKASLRIYKYEKELPYSSKSKSLRRTFIKKSVETKVAGNQFLFHKKLFSSIRNDF